MSSAGAATVKRTAYLPDNAYGITITSEYGGTDYRTSGAKLAFTGTEALNQGLFLSGDYVFENLKLECGHSDVRMVMNYHNVTIGEGVSCSRTAAPPGIWASSAGMTYPAFSKQRRTSPLEENAGLR